MDAAQLERLETLRTKRDLIESQLGSGSAYIELEIRGRRVRREEALKTLEYLNEQIRSLEASQAAAQRGPARNRARLWR
jgi:hypothetical protein